MEEIGDSHSTTCVTIWPELVDQVSSDAGVMTLGAIGVEAARASIACVAVAGLYADGTGCVAVQEAAAGAAELVADIGWIAAGGKLP